MGGNKTRKNQYGSNACTFNGYTFHITYKTRDLLVSCRNRRLPASAVDLPG